MRRSAVSQLPEEVRAELDKRLVSRGFAGYSDLSDWLAEQGFQVSRSSVHRHGVELERRIEAIKIATEQAEALVAASPDDGGAMSEAILRLAQERVFQLLLAAESGDLKAIAAAARAVAETARASTTVRAERRRALKDASEAAGDAAKKQGLSPKVVAAIRSAIEGEAT